MTANALADAKTALKVYGQGGESPAMAVALYHLIEHVESTDTDADMDETRQVLHLDEIPGPRPEWADVAMAHDREDLAKAITREHWTLLAPDALAADIADAGRRSADLSTDAWNREVAVLRQQLAEAERERDEAQRACVLALRKWAEGRDAARTAVEFLTRRIAGMEDALSIDRVKAAVIMEFRRIDAATHRRWARKARR